MNENIVKHDIYLERCTARKAMAGKPRIIKAKALAYGYKIERQVIIIVNTMQLYTNRRLNRTYNHI